MWEAQIGSSTRVTISASQRARGQLSQRSAAAIVCILMALTMIVAFSRTVRGQSATTASGQTSRATTVPPRVTQARRFLARRSWPRNQSLSGPDQPRNALTGLRPSVSAPASTVAWQPLGPSAVVTPSFGLVTGRVSSIAIDWRTVNPQLVVAAVSQAYEGTLVNAQLSNAS